MAAAESARPLYHYPVSLHLSHDGTSSAPRRPAPPHPPGRMLGAAASVIDHLSRKAESLTPPSRLTVNCQMGLKLSYRCVKTGMNAFMASSTFPLPCYRPLPRHAARHLLYFFPLAFSSSATSVFQTVDPVPSWPV